MRKTAILLLIAFCFVSFAIPVQAADTYTYRGNIANNTLLRVNYSQTGNSYLRYYTIDGGPNSALTPIVVFGDSLYGTISIYDAVRYVEAQGYTAMAAVNSDFFSMESGVPTGMNVLDGRLCSSGADWNCIAFNADGTAFCGAPEIKLTIQIGDIEYPLAGINKMRTSSGIYLFTNDFADSTKTVYDGVEVTLTSVGAKQLAINSPLYIDVLSVENTHDTKIARGGFVLSATESSDYYELLSSVFQGQRIIIKATCEDPRWANAKYISGGGNMLAVDGALVSQNVTSSSQDPRTVIGVKKDGSYRVLVCDGRLSGISNGLTFKQAAEILTREGYSDVINLDGGGSSAMLVRRPGKFELELISKPSGGATRKCSVYIVFVNRDEKVGKPFGCTVYAESENVLAGACATLKTAYYDKSYYPLAPYSATAGTVEESSVFTAPMTAQKVTISPGALGLTQVEGATINVVDRPSEIRLYSNGKALSEINCEAGDQVEIDVTARAGGMELLSSDSQFTFEVTGGVGDVTRDGLFTAAAENGLSGEIKVSFNGVSTTIPVTIETVIRAQDVVFDDYTFEDIEGHWAANYIEYLCREGIFSADTKFNPQNTITNAMTVTLISRYLGLQTDLYADIGLPYSDAESIPEWALPHVKAAYALGLLSAAFGGESFEPNAASTRAQVMTMLSMSINDNNTYPHAEFSDYADIPEWAAAHIDRLFALGIVNGYSGTDEVKPLAGITRAEMAALMIRLY